MPDPHMSLWASQGRLHIVIPETEEEADLVAGWLDFLTTGTTAIGELLDMVTSMIKDESLREHFQVLARAMVIHKIRRASYGDNWRQQGWRGGLFKLRLKVERSWEMWWGAPPIPDGLDARQADVDDLLDAINCAVMAVRAIHENNRDGKWSYPS